MGACRAERRAHKTLVSSSSSFPCSGGRNVQGYGCYQIECVLCPMHCVYNVVVVEVG